LPKERSKTEGEEPARREEASEVNQQLHHRELIQKRVNRTDQLLPEMILARRIVQPLGNPSAISLQTPRDDSIRLIREDKVCGGDN